MDSKLIPETKDTNLVFESGIQRRSSEPEIDLELTKRVAINSSVRELRIKEDSLSLLKVFQGRGNSDSPMGGVAQALTNTINISNGSLWRTPFSGNMTPVITSSDSFVAPREGFAIYENTSLTTATLNFAAFRKNFSNTITLTSGQAFLIRFKTLNGRLTLKKVSLYTAVSFPNGSRGALLVTNGQTRTILAGGVYDYSSIEVQVGGTLVIDATLTPELTQIYCTGNLINNGTIIGRRIGNGGTFSRITTVGESISFSISQSSGGRGQDGNGAVGGAGSNGFGGGGAGGAYSAPGGNGGSGGANGGAGADGGRCFGGFGGAGNLTLGVGEANRTSSRSTVDGADGGHGGGSGGGGGGGGSRRKYSSNSGGGNSGAGGGYKGQHGIGVYLYVLGTCSGSGVIDLSGTQGFNGGASVNRGFHGYGGAGGGGAGGTGGTLVVRDVGNSFGNAATTTLTTGKIYIKLTSGAGGAGGVRNYGAGGSAGSGQSGIVGTYTRQGI